ncbi:hypothetical protein LMG23992_00104 [Cupriavidus laharis]|uniref:Uncharacterized protein n=1 Tax=Cupriavidus laharis TaxID=151654 RepID=A0ABM8WCD6_9BURK|nr:hypothetical protein LMG23992_00104 [Cupriavidus laharis]
MCIQAELKMSRIFHTAQGEDCGRAVDNLGKAMLTH